MNFTYKVQFKNQDGIVLNSRFTNAKSAKQFVDHLKSNDTKQILIYRLTGELESPTTPEFLKKEAALCLTSKKKIALNSKKQSKR